MGRRFRLSLLCGVLGASALFADDFPNPDAKGVLRIGDTSWGTLHMTTEWKPSNQRNQFKPSSNADNTWRGTFAVPGAPFQLEQRLVAKGNAAVEVKSRVTAEQPVPTNLLMYQGLLPASQFAGRSLVVDGESILLPESPEGDQVVKMGQAREVRVPIGGGFLQINGSFLLMIVDNRKFGGSDFSVRLGYEPHKGEIRESQFSATLAFETSRQTPLSLASIANRTLADPVAGDGKGGWTDQGPRNDLSTFNPAVPVEGDIQFEVAASGNAALVLSKQAERSKTASASLSVTADLAATSLYLLHASAFPAGKIGTIKATYQDGEEASLEVNASHDVGNWWNPSRLENAAPVWKHTGGETNIGLYASRFPLAGKPLRTLGFQAAGEPIWMIVGATLAEANIPLPSSTSYVVKRGADWAPIELPMKVQTGSALDLSSWTDGPAGQHGAVIVTPEGHFAFEKRPQESVRFFGANLNFDANFLPKAEADELAKRLRQMGYNAVRIHHYDVLLAGGWDSKEYTINPERLDRLDYLFAAMKKQGLYISTDLFTIRRIHSPEVKEFDGTKLSVFKALIPVLPAAMDDWKRFARDLLMHKNPHTGMTWAEDPALFSICPVNEDTIWAAFDATPKVRALYEEKFEGWLSLNGLQPAGETERAAAFNQFLAGTQIAADAAMRTFLREELGSKALLTGNNWKSYRAQTPVRSHYDYVDNHLYWDHPNFPAKPWKLPYSHSQRSATQERARVPRHLFLTRIKGRPFTVTEFNYVYPNRFRNEGGALMGAYAALQDWDALFRFSWAHNAKIAVSSQPPEGFDIAADPINLLSEHIIGMFWRRGDMPALEEEAVYTVSAAEAYAGERLGKDPRPFPDAATLLGLTKRIASRFEAGAADENPEFNEQKPRTRYEATPREARAILDTAGDFLAETKFSKAMTIQKQSLDENFVRDVQGGPATIFAGALDQKPLATSQRVLILHLTNVLAEGAKFGEEGMYSIAEQGRLPLLVRAGSAEVALPHHGTKSGVALHALDLAGNRIAEIPFEVSGGVIRFQVKTIPSKGGPRMTYELVREGVGSPPRR